MLTRTPRPSYLGVGGLTGLRPLPPTPKKEKFPCQEKCSRVPNCFLFKNKRNFTGALICSRVPSRFHFKNKRNFTVALIMKHWKRDFEENFGIPLIYTRSTRVFIYFCHFSDRFPPQNDPEGGRKSIPGTPRAPQTVPRDRRTASGGPSSAPRRPKGRLGTKPT